MAEQYQINLTQGKIAIVDKDDYGEVSKLAWHFSNGYAVHKFYDAGRKPRSVGMHAFIVNTPEGMETDHINRDRLDNRRDNLRIVTSSQNQHNTKVGTKNTSGHKGVTFHFRDKYWQAMIRKNGKRLYLGSYKQMGEAVRAYQNAERGIL